MSTQTDVPIPDVVIVGAGPTGLMLAGDLAAASVRVVVLDRTAEPVESPKGNGVVGRAALELRRRKLLQGTGLRVMRPTRFPFGPLTLESGCSAVRCMCSRCRSTGWSTCWQSAPYALARQSCADTRSPVSNRTTPV